MDAQKLTDAEIDLIANDGMRNAAGGIYSTRVHEFARSVEAAVRDALQAELASMTRMFHAACADLGAINEALGLDPDDGGAEPIIGAIEELKAQIAALAHSDAVQAPIAWMRVTDITEWTDTEPESDGWTPLAPVDPAAAGPSDDAYVAQRMAQLLAEVYATIIGDDARPEDEALPVIERVKKAAQVLRLEVDLYRAQRDESHGAAQ